MEKYTIWLVEFAKRTTERSYQDFPRIFSGNKEEYNCFMQKHYPEAVRFRKLFASKEEVGQWEKFTALRDKNDYPITPYLQVHISRVGTSGFLEDFLIKAL